MSGQQLEIRVRKRPKGQFYRAKIKGELRDVLCWYAFNRLYPDVRPPFWLVLTKDEPEDWFMPMVVWWLRDRATAIRITDDCARLSLIHI